MLAMHKKLFHLYRTPKRVEQSKKSPCVTLNFESEIVSFTPEPISSVTSLNRAATWTFFRTWRTKPSEDYLIRDGRFRVDVDALLTRDLNVTHSTGLETPSTGRQGCAAHGSHINGRRFPRSDVTRTWLSGSYFAAERRSY